MPRLALLVLLAALAATAADVLPRGQVVDRVACQGEPGESYALYLPRGYEEGRTWPILYCFDPGGRGSVPVALFREAAERHGWILAGSNVSRNGPWDVIIRGARVLWNDTRARFRVDEARVYATGFSGGARVACGLARILSIRLAGVIGCGAGLPEWLEYKDVAATPWFGAVGRSDFNFGEMQEMSRRLRRQGTPCSLRVFPGGHDWPPSGLAMEAVAWLEEVAAAGVDFPPRDAYSPGGEGKEK